MNIDEQVFVGNLGLENLSGIGFLSGWMKLGSGKGQTYFAF